MAKHINIRQIEAFKAFIETGTVTRAAETLGVTQPAISKLLTHLEADTGLQLFERRSGRLTITESGRRLYNQIDRIFYGLRQIEQSVELIRREEMERLVIGVMPALSGLCVTRIAADFLRYRPDVDLVVTVRSSQFLADWVATGQIDVGLVLAPFNNRVLETEPFLVMPLVCIMPKGHALESRTVIEPEHLCEVPFVSFAPDTAIGNQVNSLLSKCNLSAKTVISANHSSTICELVAGGLGVSLVHPLLAHAFRSRITVRAFAPEIPLGFLLCYMRSGRSGDLVQVFLDQARTSIKILYNEIASAGSGGGHSM